MTIKVMIIAGTRPEAIKMAPVVMEFRKHPEFTTLLCNSGQHREMINETFRDFANDAYAKRDCVEKVFQALKSHLGMDKIGVTTEEAMHGKGLVWFVASILHALMFNGTKNLRSMDRKNFTVPAMIDQLEAIKADQNLSTGKRERRFKLTSRQQKILNQWKINEAFIDDRIASISE